MSTCPIRIGDNNRICGRAVRAPCGKCDACCGHWTEAGGHECDGFQLPKMERVGPYLLMKGQGPRTHIAGHIYTACGIEIGHWLKGLLELGGYNEVTCDGCLVPHHKGYVADYLVEHALLNPREEFPNALKRLVGEAVLKIPDECEHSHDRKPRKICVCLPPCRCQWDGERCAKNLLKHTKGQIRCDNPPWRNAVLIQPPAPTGLLARASASGGIDELRARFRR